MAQVMGQNMAPNMSQNMGQEQNWWDKLKEFFVGANPKIQSIDQFDPKMRGDLDQLLNMAMGQLRNNSQQFNQPFGGQALLNQTMGALNPGNFDFSKIRQGATQHFNEQIAPSIANRFISMGGSSRSGNQSRVIERAGQNLALGLGQLEGNYNLQQQGQLGDLFRALMNAQLGHQGQQQSGLMGLLQLGLTPRTNQAVIPGTSGFIQQSSQRIAEALPQILKAAGGI